MKFIKFSLFIISFLFINSVHAQKKSRSFKEFNTGICLDLWNSSSVYEAAFPGASFLWGKTYQNNKRIFEWQGGLAFPTIVTGKLTLAHGKLDKYSGISLRVWPPTIGPQFKINKLILSAEIGPDAFYLDGVWGIFTVGFRR